MRKRNNILIGVLSFIPPLYIIFFITTLIYLMKFVPHSKWENILSYVIVIHFIVVALNIILLIIFGMHILRNKNMDDRPKGYWICGIIGTLTIAMPIYWFIHMSEDEPFAFLQKRDE